MWRAENSELNSLLKCRGEKPVLSLIHRESEMNNFVPDHKQLASCGRVNARKAHWLAPDWIISIVPDRLPRKRVKQGHRIPVEGVPGGEPAAASYPVAAL